MKNDINKDILKKNEEHEVVPLRSNEVDEAAEVLSKSFQNDPLMLWVFGSPEFYNNYSTPVFKTWITYCLLYGAAYRTQDFGSVAILKTPGFSEFSLWGVIRSGMILNLWSLGINGWKRLMQFDALSSEHAKTNMVGKEYWYLWMLGTRPELQGKGLGSAVLKKIDGLLEERTGTSCYLDASSQSSVSLYKKNGYKGFNFFKLPESDIRIDCMEKVSNLKN